jgi:lipid-binding SYLF domain-containing protein
MSVKKLGTVVFSSFLIFATAPVGSAQQNKQDTTKKQTTSQPGTATKEEGKTTSSNKTSTTTSTATQSTTPDQSTVNTTDKAKSHTGKTGTKKSTAKKTSGVSKDTVRQVQTALKKEGFNPGPTDGMMGPMTMTALRSYQSHKGLEVTGTISPETQNSLLGRSETASHTYSTHRKSSSGGNISSDIADVREMQQKLDGLGYDPGAINGMMSSETQRAVRQFQWFNDLPVTGNLDEPTKIAIDSQYEGGYSSAHLRHMYSAHTSRSKPTASQSTTSTTSAQGTKAAPSRDYDTSAKSTETKAKTNSAEVYKESGKEGSHRIAKSSEVLVDLTSAGDKKIPHELLERAEAVVVIPHVVKGAFGLGGRYGKGVVSQRLASGRWSAPAFVQIGGGSFGAQIGVSATDLVLVFTDRKALDLLEKGKDLKLGVDAAIVAGPIGRTAEAGVNANLESAIYSYSRSKGLFAGVALDGAVLDIDNSMNEKVYGPSADAKTILNGQTAANATVRPFVQALEKYMPKPRISQK